MCRSSANGVQPVFETYPSKNLKMMKKLRDLLLIGLALGLSPIPACAQMVCDINCSIQSAGAHGVKAATDARQVAGEQQSEPEKHSQRHCDDEALAASSDSGPARESARMVKNVCRANGCTADLELNAPATTQTASQNISPFAKAKFQRPALPDDSQASEPLTSPECSPLGLGVLAFSGVLRI